MKRVARSWMAGVVAATWSLPAACGSDGPSGPPPDGEVTPPPSAGHSLVYANDLHVVLLVNAGLGGMSSPPASTPTRVWAWDGTRWSVLDSAGPPVRNLAGVAYDTRRHALVIHGGTYDLGQSYGETWEWTSANGWRQSAASGPGIRDHTQMAFDAACAECAACAVS